MSDAPDFVGLVPDDLRAGGPVAHLHFDLSTAVDDLGQISAEITLDPSLAEAFMAPTALAALQAILAEVWAHAPQGQVARAQAVYNVIAARQGVLGLALKVGREGCWLCLKGGLPTA